MLPALISARHRAARLGGPVGRSTDRPDVGVLCIYEAIGGGLWGGGISAKDVSGALLDLGSVSELEVHLSSEGGDVFEGKAIYNALARFPAKKTVYVDGLAASIATVIAMAGDRIITSANATWMVHNPWTLTIGDAADHEKTRGILESEGESIASTYAKRTGRPVAELLALMAKETWMTAGTAKELGFTDEIAGQDGVPLPKPGARARHQLSSVRSRPESARAQMAGIRAHRLLFAVAECSCGNRAESFSARTGQMRCSSGHESRVGLPPEEGLV